MIHTCLLSEDAKTYLCCFYQTLDGMVQEMTTTGLTQSISHNFIVQMIPRHRAAIRMSNNILRFTEHKAVRCLAQQIVKDEAQGIGQMEEILPVCGRLTNAQADLRLYQRRMELICRQMYAQMNAAPESSALAAVFLREMLPHCRGAVLMAENALKYDVSAELVPILRATAAQQRRNAAQMRTLLSRMECRRG